MNEAAGKGRGLPAPSRLFEAVDLLEREGLGDVAGVLRLAASAEEAVRARLEAPNAPLFGRLTACLPPLLRTLPGRVPLFYSPTVAALLSMLGTRRAKGEPDAFAEVAEALSPARPGKRKALAERDRDREALQFADSLVEDLKRLNAATRGRTSAAEILAHSPEPVRPELAIALASARRKRLRKLPCRKLAAWAWNEIGEGRGTTFAASEVPPVMYREADAVTALYNLRALEKRVAASEYGRNSIEKPPSQSVPNGRTFPSVANAATPHGMKRRGSDGGKAHVNGGPGRRPPREAGERPADAVGRVGAAIHPKGKASLVRPRRRPGMDRGAEANVNVRPEKGRLRKPP